MEENEIIEEVQQKFTWKAKYTLVLLMNAAYIILFYFLMKNYA